MTPRYQKVLLWLLLLGSVWMAATLIRMRARAEDQFAAAPDAAPMPAPVEAPTVPVTLLIASDADGSLTPVQRRVALPAEPTTRARTLLNDLMREYSRPGSSHPLAATPAVSDVFLLPVPSATTNQQNRSAQPQIAVVNLNGIFADHHPSGILVETLTLLSILGTLRANLPQVQQVRFLVDGQPRETLAGHADLTRTYLTANDVPAESAGNPSSQAGAEPAP